MINLNAPLTKNDLAKLRAGDIVSFSGKLITARDQAHKRAITDNLSLINNSIVFYTGPAFKDGKITSCGPTSSYRMDKYFYDFCKLGMLGAIGKGERDESILKLCQQEKVVYFIIPGGFGATVAKSVLQSKLLAYPDLLSEAIYELEVKDLKLIVAYDVEGNQIFKK